MTEHKVNLRARKVILELVENQIRENDPPEVRHTLERLMAEGCSRDEAKRLIAIALSVEVYHILKDGESYNHDRYVWHLKRLPEEPWDENGENLYPGGRTTGRHDT